MNLTLIAAMSENRVIGKDNQLIWHMPKDLRHFRELTTGHHIIMGRKTYESVGKPLPNRTNIILTRDRDYSATGCIVVHDLKAAIAKAEGDPQPFITGGSEVYKAAMPYASTIELTIIQSEFEGDAYFPEIPEDFWQLEKREDFEADEKNPYPFSFLTYKKR